MKLYKLVVRDKNGRVVQIHEQHLVGMLDIITREIDRGYSVTVTELSN